LQESLHRLSDLLPMISSYFGYVKIYLAMSSWKKRKQNVSRETFCRKPRNNNMMKIFKL
jgi:hypothetical protein